MKKEKFWDPHWDISLIMISVILGTLYSFVFSPSSFSKILIQSLGIGFILSGLYTIVKKRISKFGYPGNYAYSRSVALISGIFYIIIGIIFFSLMLRSRF